MKLVKNWHKAYASLAVILPTLGNIAVLLEVATGAGLIPPQYVPLVSVVITPTLAYLGRIIQQPSLNM